MLLAIDPGSSQSAYVLFDEGSNTPIINRFGKANNEVIIQGAAKIGGPDDTLAIEFPRVRGMQVMQQVLDTCLVAGRIIQAWPGKWARIDRGHVKNCICGSSRATDSNIRTALLGMFPPTGGGKTPQIGVKAKPGPLYGLSADMWAALAVGITYQQRGESDFGVNSDREGLGP